MSKLTSTHRKLANAARWIARNLAAGTENEVEIDGGVERYHRADRYRELTIGAATREIADEIERRLKAYSGSPTGVRVHFDKIFRNHRGAHVLQVSVWPA